MRTKNTFQFEKKQKNELPTLQDYHTLTAYVAKLQGCSILKIRSMYHDATYAKWEKIINRLEKKIINFQKKLQASAVPTNNL
jgi:hypothetical protein